MSINIIWLEQHQQQHISIQCLPHKQQRPKIKCETDNNLKGKTLSERQKADSWRAFLFSAQESSKNSISHPPAWHAQWASFFPTDLWQKVRSQKLLGLPAHTTVPHPQFYRTFAHSSVVLEEKPQIDALGLSRFIVARLHQIEIADPTIEPCAMTSLGRFFYCMWHYSAFS